jgi:hypothetical protein
MSLRTGLALSLRLATLACCAAAAPAGADPIRHPTAIFAGLDKTTGRIINFDVGIDETVQFRTLLITPRVCNTRPQTETPQTTSFVEVDEQLPRPDQRREQSGEVRVEPQTNPKPEVKRIFSGWMFASSPGLHGVEHPVYDVWLVDCKGGQEAAASPDPAAATPAAATAPAEAPRSPTKTGRAANAPATDPGQPGASDDPVYDPAVTGDPGAAPPPQKKKKKRKNPPAPAVAPQDAPAPNAGGLF